MEYLADESSDEDGGQYTIASEKGVFRWNLMERAAEGLCGGYDRTRLWICPDLVWYAVREIMEATDLRSQDFYSPWGMRLRYY